MNKVFTKAGVQQLYWTINLNWNKSQMRNALRVTHSRLLLMYLSNIFIYLKRSNFFIPLPVAFILFHQPIITNKNKKTKTTTTFHIRNSLQEDIPVFAQMLSGVTHIISHKQINVHSFAKYTIKSFLIQEKVNTNFFKRRLYHGQEKRIFKNFAISCMLSHIAPWGLLKIG